MYQASHFFLLGVDDNTPFREVISLGMSAAVVPTIVSERGSAGVFVMRQNITLSLSASVA